MTEPFDEAMIEAELLLRGFDDPHSLEAPRDFDHIEANARLLRLAHEVTQLVGEDCELETWPAIQDASFHGAIWLPQSVLTDLDAASIRTSNFGRLITVYDSDNVVKPEILAALRVLFERSGYRYVPSAALRRPYKGRHGASDRLRDWGTRYFDYL